MDAKKDSSTPPPTSLLQNAWLWEPARFYGFQQRRYRTMVERQARGPKGPLPKSLLIAKDGKNDRVDKNILKWGPLMIILYEVSNCYVLLPI